jgi:hypothetical protein
MYHTPCAHSTKLRTRKPKTKKATIEKPNSTLSIDIYYENHVCPYFSILWEMMGASHGAV